MTVMEERENLIVKYIEEHDCKTSKNSVVAYMISNRVRPDLRLAKVAVYQAIGRLIKANRIMVCNEATVRQGQTHYLGINRESAFDRIIELISENENKFPIFDKDYNPIRTKDETEAIRVYDELWTQGINHFWTAIKLLLVKTKNEINTDVEARICYNRITEFMLKLTNIEFKVRRYIDQLKEYVRYKKKSSKSKKRLSH